MKRLSFLVIHGENNCFMVHGLNWAAYAEGYDWGEVTDAIKSDVARIFSGEAAPAFLDFRFLDGRVVSFSA